MGGKRAKDSSDLFEEELSHQMEAITESSRMNRISSMDKLDDVLGKTSGQNMYSEKRYDGDGNEVNMGDDMKLLEEMQNLISAKPTEDQPVNFGTSSNLGSNEDEIFEGEAFQTQYKEILTENSNLKLKIKVLEKKLNKLEKQKKDLSVPTSQQVETLKLELASKESILKERSAQISDLQQ